MRLRLRSLLLALAASTLGTNTFAETVIVHLRPVAQSLVLGTIDTEDEAFAQGTPVEADSDWYRTRFFGSFAGFVERSALGPDGRIRIGTEVFLTPSREGVKMTTVEPEDQITVNLVDRWVEITFRKSLEAYFRKPEVPEGTSVEPDFAVTVPRDDDPTAAALILPPEPAPAPAPPVVESPPPAAEPSVASEAVANDSTPTEPARPDPEVLVLAPVDPAIPETPARPTGDLPPMAPEATSATILTPDPIPQPPVATSPAVPDSAPDSSPLAIIEDAPVVIEGASVAGIPEQELGRQPRLQPASGLVRRFDGQIREVRWIFRRPPFRFELRDYNNDHVAYLDLSRAVISSFTDLKDSVVIVYGTIEGIGTSSKRVIRVQTLSRRR